MTHSPYFSRSIRAVAALGDDAFVTEISRMLEDLRAGRIESADSTSAVDIGKKHKGPNLRTIGDYQWIKMKLNF
jgi:hypothetical protein